MDSVLTRLWLHYCLLPGLGSARLARLATAFDSRGQLDKSRLQQLAQKLPKALSQQVMGLAEHNTSFYDPRIDSWLAWAGQTDHHLLLLPDPAYPALLKLIADPPPLLFLLGQPELIWQPQLAIVGSRRPSVQGQEQAYRFAATLAEHGFTITSGLASGIDGAAHKGALGKLGSTIAVLGCGIDVIYPTHHRQLASQIAATGLLISEFPLGTSPKAGNFPRRNRIISGLSLGTLVVEASIRSGSLITARAALEQGREVFAMPGSTQNPQARGCHALIKEGAALVEKTDDIFAGLPQLMSVYQQRQLPAAREFRTRWSQQIDKLEPDPGSGYKSTRFVSGVDTGEQISAATPDSGAQDLAGIDVVAEQVLEAIGFDVTHPDLIVQRTGLSVNEIQTHLMQFELMGLIRRESGGVLRIR